MPKTKGPQPLTRRENELLRLLLAADRELDFVAGGAPDTVAIGRVRADIKILVQREGRPSYDPELASTEELIDTIAAGHDVVEQVALAIMEYNQTLRKALEKAGARVNGHKAEEAAASA